MNVKYEFKNCITVIVIVISLHILIDMLKPKVVNYIKSDSNKNRIYKVNSNKNIQENFEHSDTVSAKTSTAFTRLENLANTTDILLTDSDGNMSTMSLNEIYESIYNKYNQAITYINTKHGQADTNATNKYNQAVGHVNTKHNQAIAHINTKQPEGRYLTRNTSYKLRSTNMNYEHCLSDSGHDRLNGGTWAKAEWYNSGNFNDVQPCLNVQFL